MQEPHREFERIAVLEERSQSQSAQIDDVVGAIRELTREVMHINQKLDRNSGFLSGVAFAFSLIGAVIGTCGGEMLRKIMRGEV